MATYKIVGGDGKEYGPVTLEQLREWITQGRAGANTLAWTEGGVWKKLSSYPELADLFPAAAGQILASAPPTIGVPVTPPAVPGSATYGSPPAMPVGGAVSAKDAKSMVQGPAIGLIILGLLAFPSVILNLFMGMAGMQQGMPPGAVPPELEHVMSLMQGATGVVLNLVSLALGILVLVGGIRMMALRNHGLCMAAAILAIIPCTSSCCCIGIPLGIWALVVLMKPEVKSAFS